ncbi:MAG: sugar phosphate isomerase/epimerase family protein [Verrucomicrobiota bacterium]
MNTSSSRTSRRQFAALTTAAMAATLCPLPALPGETPVRKRLMRLTLSPGAIGVKANPRETLALAHQYGFEAIEPNANFLTDLSDADLAAFRAEMQARNIVFGSAGLAVNFRQDDAKFRTSLEALPKIAAGLQRAGVTRVGTWISPTHAELAYADNLRQHATRLREAAKVLRDHGQRLGLEYVGTPSIRQNRPNPFIYSLRQMQELIAEIGTGNVGVVLDSWHWWTAGETEADLLKLTNADVVSVDLNDAPAGIPLPEQQDGKRELPCATGVIPVKTFLGALQRISYDGPVRAEPFNKPLNAMDKDAACAATIAALKKAAALITDN